MNNEFTYYPVIIPTLCRYDHLKELLESLKANTHAEKTEVYISLDFPPSERYEEGWQKIKQYLPSVKGFKNLIIFEQSKNLGASANSEFLKQQVKKYYDAYIYTEDDNVFSPCFLDFMNKCLNYYRFDKRVVIVSGFLEPTKFSVIGDLHCSLSWYSAWGYGIWFDRKEELESNICINDYRVTVFNKKENLQTFSKWPRVANHTMEWLKELPYLNNQFCDITVESELILGKKVCILPTISLVRNNGHDGSGIHCGDASKSRYIQQIISDEKEYRIDFTKPWDGEVFSREIENFLFQYENQSSISNTVKKLKLLEKHDLLAIEKKQQSKLELIEKIKKSLFGKILLAIKHRF